jgi:hypothetical protein
MQNGKLSTGAAIAVATLIAANAPIAIGADKDHRIASSWLKAADRCRKPSGLPGLRQFMVVRRRYSRPRSSCDIAVGNDCF